MAAGKPVRSYGKASKRDKRRWISWASRHYGPSARKKGRYKTASGKPTAKALQALRWGESPPKNQGDAAKLYAKAQRRKRALDPNPNKRKGRR